MKLINGVIAIIKGLIWSVIATPVILVIVWICGTILETFIPEAKGIKDVLMAIFKPVLEFVDNIPFPFN